MLKSSYFWLFMAAVCGATLFQTSQRVTDGRSELAKVERDTRREEESLRVLQAEWSYLNQPERLEKLAREYLNLEPMNGRQFAKATDLDENVEQIVANNGHDLIVDGAAVMPVAEEEAKVVKVSETTSAAAAPVAKAAAPATPPAPPAVPKAAQAAKSAPAKPTVAKAPVKTWTPPAKAPQPVIRYQPPVQAAAPQARPYVAPQAPAYNKPATAAVKPAPASSASRNFGDVMKSLEID